MTPAPVIAPPTTSLDSIRAGLDAAKDTALKIKAGVDALTPAATPVTTLNAPVTPLNVAPASNAPIPNIAAIPTVPNTPSIQPVAPTPPAGSTLISGLQTLLATKAGKAGDTSAAITDATLPYQKQLDDINYQIGQHQANTLANQEKVMAGGGDTSFQSGEGQRVARNDAIETLRLSSIAQALQGNIDTAKSQAQASIDAKYGQVEADIQTAKTNIKNIYDTLTPEEKKQADATLLDLDANDAFIKQKKDDEAKIMTIAATAAANGLTDLATITKIQKASTPEEALSLAAASGFAVNPLDQKLKQSQIDQNNAAAAKALADANASGNGVNMSPEDLIAYAQQYASTGTIPTGLPKGSFGVVSQYAKELPKAEGEIVDNNTNIKSGKLTATQADAYGALRDLTNKLTEAQGLYDKLNTGVIGGTFGNIFPTQTREAYNTLRSEMVDLLARARTGAAISASEEALYKSKIPGTFNQSFFVGQSGDSKLTGLKDSISGKLDAGLRANGVSMYGFSTVKLGGQEYKVGDIISVNGQTGRVLPDGSIAIIAQ